MLNLLTHKPSRQVILDAISQPALTPYLHAYDHPAWAPIINQPVMAPFVEEVLRMALEEAAEPLPVLTDELYGDYTRTGDRSSFERPYFERRRRLGRAAFALLAATQAPRPDPAQTATLTASFRDKLRDVAAEESWAVTAHVRPASGKDAMCIDLFSSETAFNMAEFITVFGAVIPTELVAELRARMRTQFFENYRNNPDGFHWTRGTSNWNAVCYQGVLGAALLAEADRELVADMLVLAADGRLSRFIDGFADDGGCSEGPGYWSYGFGWFAALNEQLEIQSAGRLSLFEGNAKINRIARYAVAVSLYGGQSVNFADGGSGPMSPGLLYYVGTRLGEEACVRLASENWRSRINEPKRRGIYDALRGNFFYWRRMFTHVPPLPAADAEAGAPEPLLPPDAYLDKLGVWVARGRDSAGHVWDVAAKGGHNNEHHNHNDVGSLLLNIDGVQMLVEIGAPFYVREFFGPARYGFLAARSLGHSLPLIRGTEQLQGADYHGEILRAEVDQPTVTFEVDATCAYPTDAACARYLRRITLDKAAGRLVLEDSVCGQGAKPWGQVNPAVPGLDATPFPAAVVEFALIFDAAATVVVESPTIATATKAGITLRLELADAGSEGAEGSAGSSKVHATASAHWLRVDKPTWHTHGAGELTHVNRLVAVPTADDEGDAERRFRAIMTVV
ncbi:heparinase [Verrucomicrobia bacterium LW23]|nr:heparinase [Verrucomicrobia bacterium LW23]